MYSVKIEIKDRKENITFASDLDLLLSKGRNSTAHFYIRQTRRNCLFLSSNIPYSQVCDVFISQLIRYARTCFSYECFILRVTRLSSKQLKKEYILERLKSSFRECYGRGSYKTIWSLPFSNVNWHSAARPVTVTSQPIRLFANFMII